MKTFNYQFNNLPSSLIANESRLDKFKAGIIKDIKYEGGFEAKEYQFMLEGNALQLSVQLPNEKVELITCALINLHDAK